MRINTTRERLAQGETVLDVPAKLAARVRVFDTGNARKTGREVIAPLFYYVFALFKIAVIVQQIYKRYVEGSTSDPRFRARFGGPQSHAGKKTAPAGN